MRGILEKQTTIHTYFINQKKKKCCYFITEMGCFVHSGVAKHVTKNSRRPDQPTEEFVNCFCNIVHLVSLAFLLPCSSVLVIVSVERKKQRSIGNPIKNNWPDSQSHLLSAGILLMLSQLPTTQFPPVMPERQATGTAIWQSAVRESLVSITDGEPRLS